jgi:hypothetical protein
VSEPYWEPLAAAANSSYGASPPANPVDGQIWYWPFVSDAIWAFRYVADVPTYKWVFVGGPAFQSQPSGNAPGVSGSAYVDLSGGPNFQLTRPGYYAIEFGAFVQNAGGWAAPYEILVRAHLAGMTSVESHFIPAGAYNGGQISSVWGVTLATGGWAVNLQHSIQGGYASNVMNGWLRIIPARVA